MKQVFESPPPMFCPTSVSSLVRSVTKLQPPNSPIQDLNSDHTTFVCIELDSWELLGNAFQQVVETKEGEDTQMTIK